MNISKINEKTIHVDFPSREELLKTFIRFQEFYESPEFRGKIFNLSEYEQWYKKYYNNDTFTYYEDWSGCNVPSYVFDFFRTGAFNPLSERELKLLEALPETGRFYVIGTFNGGDKDVLIHEAAHSLYYSNDEYKKEVNVLLEKYNNQLVEVKKHIIELGYNEAVILDETQAYVGASSDYLKEEGIEYPEELSKLLQELIIRYS